MAPVKDFYDYFDPGYTAGEDRMENVINNQTPSQNIMTYMNTLANKNMTPEESQARNKAITFIMNHVAESNQPDYSDQVLKLIHDHREALQLQVLDNESDTLRRKEVGIIDGTIQMNVWLLNKNEKIQKTNPATIGQSAHNRFKTSLN